jgi:hypothetical protein
LISAIASQAWHLEENSTILYSRIVSISKEKIYNTYVRNASELCDLAHIACLHPIGCTNVLGHMTQPPLKKHRCTKLIERFGQISSAF